MSRRPFLSVAGLGQSIWLDRAYRGMVSSGEIDRFIEQDGLAGARISIDVVEKVLSATREYDQVLETLVKMGKQRYELYRYLLVEDARLLADRFLPVYDRTDGMGGYVSVPLSPRLAISAEAASQEAGGLFNLVDRPNVVIEIPGSREILPAIEQLTSEGVNLLVTPVMEVELLRQSAEFYVAGARARLDKGGDVGRLFCAIGFPMNEIDILVDSYLEMIVQEGGPKSEIARMLQTRTGVSLARVAYQARREIFSSGRFAELRKAGARELRLMWYGTTTLNPSISETFYIDELIGPGTINSISIETYHAYREHGEPEPKLDQFAQDAHLALEHLGRIGVDLGEAYAQVNESVDKLTVQFDQLVDAILQKPALQGSTLVESQAAYLAEFQAPVQEAMLRLEQEHFIERLLQKDPALWKADPENQASIRKGLGWLHLGEKMAPATDELYDLVNDLVNSGLHRAVLVGMGGSSLASLVFERTFAPAKDAIQLTVLDSDDPATVLGIEREVSLSDTLFIVASKSGTTAEPLSLNTYFYAHARGIMGEAAGNNFAAITDPGTPLADLARQRHYRRLFLSYRDVGGRYSALSPFGMVPAALMGLNISEMLDRTRRMMYACHPGAAAAHNPGLSLGSMLGELARTGRDKATFVFPAGLEALGMWLEQLLAESLGKEGKGIVPVVGERPGDPSVYSGDRFFVYYRLREHISGDLEVWTDFLKRAGFPVIQIDIDDSMDLGQEFFRWEYAVATAGAMLGINPFDQPNVEESKENTNRVLAEMHKTGEMPEVAPTLVEGPLKFDAELSAPDGKTLVRNFLGQARPGDYVAVQAFLPETRQTEETLQAIRNRLRDSLRLATTIGCGPRFLHSTGQLHKGGPNTGMFVQLTADDDEDMVIPGVSHTFGALKRAQALGDLQALRKHGRRVLRIHLGQDVVQGLKNLESLLEPALVTSL